AAGGAGDVLLRADDPLDGEILARFSFTGSPRYSPQPVRSELTNGRLAEVYLVCETPGVIMVEVGFEKI
ncbi:MAG TPA: hypothetical protein DGG94_08125, partial [Micromonosporaceae bacterium]|nr:hypothetical protein [Micromonosporaceae bacterium]